MALLKLKNDEGILEENQIQAHSAPNKLPQLCQHSQIWSFKDYKWYFVRTSQIDQAKQDWLY